MAKLKGFLRSSNIEELSTIAVNRTQKKQIHPTRFNSKNAAQTMYTRFCLDHKEGPVVTIDLYAYDPSAKGFSVVGEGKSCVLCWKIIRRQWNEEATRLIDFETGKFKYIK